MKLVLVETSAQAKTLTDNLGEGWRVEACQGFVRALPADTLGINVNDDFRPTFIVAPGKGNLVRRLMKAIRECEAVYAATPPGHNGEAMAWHVLALSPDAKDKLIYRVTLHALTPDAIRAAFAAPSPLDMNAIEADLTERIVDRLVGWGVNVTARKALGFKTALSFHGMVALRLLAQRDHEITAFTPETRWRAAVAFQIAGVSFTAHVLNAKGAPLALRNEEQATQLRTLLEYATFWVDKTRQVMKATPAPAALTLPTLITTAERELGLSPTRTLGLLATLYEAGWITHPDGHPLPALSEAARAHVRREYGTDYVTSDTVITDGIAPADIYRIPEDLPGDGSALYGLIWRQFIAAHMTPAQERITATRILVGATQGKPYPLELRTITTLPYFDGWRRVLPMLTNREAIPSFVEGETLAIQQVVTDTVTSEAPAHYTLVALAKALVDNGFAVPSAVRAVEQLQAAGYITADEDRLTLSQSGRVVADYLAITFAELTSLTHATEFTADIDQIAAGERERLDVLRAFWSRFGGALSPAATQRVVEHKPIVLRPAEEV